MSEYDDGKDRLVKLARRPLQNANKRSLEAMREALHCVVTIAEDIPYDETTPAAFKDLHETKIAALSELSEALELAVRGEKHPALVIKKNQSQRRAYTRDKEKFLEYCFRASDLLVSFGAKRGQADTEVLRWADKKAAKLGIGLGGERPLAVKRTRRGWRGRDGAADERSRRFNLRRLRSAIEN